MLLKREYEDTARTLRNLVLKGAHHHYGKVLTNEQSNRIDMELDAIIQAGREKYFLIVGDIVCKLREYGVTIALGEGPSSGSVVCYCLNITGIDPLRYGLSFERFFYFTNNTAIWLLVDSIFKRDIIDMLMDNYGKQHVARIANPDQTNKLGVYPTSVVISDNDIERLMPTRIVKDLDSGKNILAVECPRMECESKGLYRIEYLGHYILEIIRFTLDRIRQMHGITIDITQIPMDDAATYKLFQEGKDCGVFRSDWPLIKEFMPKTKPQSFDELVMINAINQKCGQCEETMKEYLRLKEGEQEIKHYNSQVDEVLKETYGLLIYDEQMIQLANILADIPPRETARMYHAMQSKNKEEEKTLISYEQKFVNGGIQNGHSKEMLQNLWEKCHHTVSKASAVNVTWVVYISAWLKAHYMAEYMTETLRFFKSKKFDERVEALVDDCRKNGLHVKEEVRDYSIGIARKGKKNKSFKLKFITITNN